MCSLVVQLCTLKDGNNPSQIQECVIMRFKLRFRSLSFYRALHKNYLFLQMFLSLNLLVFVTDTIKQVKEHTENRLLSKYMDE